MKKISILIITLLLATAAATAQTSSRWGITAGANFNEVHFKQSDIVPSKRAWGPQLGVTLKQGKVNYGDRTMWESLGAGNETLSMHYLDVPLHLKLKWRRLNGLETTFMPLVYVGPQFSFLVGANHRDLNSYPPVNVYLDMGLGFELMERWQLRAGYNFSIGQSFHTKLLDDNVAKNRTWYVNLTWFLK